MPSEPLLLAAFRELYRAILRGKRVALEEARSTRLPPAADAAATAGGAEPRVADPATAIREELTALLERQAALAARIGGAYGSEVYRAAQYVMAALADDVFLHLEWAGRERWQAHLLESHLFGTHRAGEEIFRRLDGILEHRDTIYIDLAKVYLLALALGFEGRYRAPGGAARLEAYQRDLYSYVANRDPELLAGERPLFPEAYASTLDEGKAVRLPYLKPWIVAGAGLGVLWLAAAHALWHGLTERLEPVLRQILGAG